MAGRHVNLAGSLYLGTEVAPGEGAKLNTGGLHLGSAEKNFVWSARWGSGGCISSLFGFAATGDEKWKQGTVGEEFHKTVL
ncbi:hypothetical protein GCM10027044_25770 [Hymenobacter ruber]